MTTAGQTATSAVNPHVVELQSPIGLIGEFLRLVGIPSTACAVVASGLWTLQQQLQQQPVAWTPAIACALAGLMSIFQWAYMRRNNGLATLIAIVIGLALTATAITYGASGNAAVSAVWMMATFQFLIAMVSCPIPKLSNRTMASDDAEPAAAPSENELIVSDVSSDIASDVFWEARKRGRWIALAILIAAFFVYMVMVPAIGMVIEAISKPKVSSRVLTDMTLSESMRLHSVSGVVMLCFLAMGASIGSFLNVVIYRLPRCKPLLWPPSSCGSCGTRIQGKDNIPIFAWIFLGGRCRHCHTAVSSRYPLVEVAVAAIFVLFYYVELLSGGDNLPVRSPNAYRGIVWILLYTKWDLVLIYLTHMFTLTSLLAWGMMNWDGFPVPKRSSLVTLLVMTTAIAMFPWLYPIGQAGMGGLILPGYLTPIFGVASGAVVGGLMALAFPLATPPVHDNSGLYGATSQTPAIYPSSVMAFALVGVVFGVQFMLAVAVITSVIALLLRMTSCVESWRYRLPVTLIVCWVSVLYLSVWRQVDMAVVQPMYWPVSRSSVPALACWCIALSVALVICTRVGKKPEIKPPPTVPTSI